MSKYINREDACVRLWKKLRELSDVIPMGKDAAGVAVRIIEDMPVADEVVRCKDCKYRINENGNCYVSNFIAGLPCMIRYVGKDDYCSYGERKEQEHEDNNQLPR